VGDLDAVTIVLNLEELQAPVLGNDRDRGGPGITTVLNHLLHCVSGALQDLEPEEKGKKNGPKQLRNNGQFAI